MLITLLSYFGDGDDTENCENRSTVRDNMSSGDDDNNDGEWERISFPISVDEDYEIVIPPSYVDATTSNNSILRRIREWRHQRTLQRRQLGTSISKTFVELSKEDPNRMEEDAIQRAMELSMLDFALVRYHHHPSNANNRPRQQEQKQPSPHDVLGVANNASPREIRDAYRRLARGHHPDKGGDAHRFEEIARAYRSLLSSGLSGSRSAPDSSFEDASLRPRLTTASCDKELQDHRRLVNALFEADGMDLEACVVKQLSSLEILGLAFRDAGAINRNERDEIIHNSCFYLSLATSYLWGIGALSFNNNNNNDNVAVSGRYENDEDELLVGETALQLKRTIEAAVVKSHPEWVLQGKVGEEVQAFSDFLVYTLDSHTLLSEWAIVVFDATSGFCDIYKGRQYNNQGPSMQSNTITLRYIPGHYQPLVPSQSFARRPALNDITTTLDDLGVFYVITDGNSPS